MPVPQTLDQENQTSSLVSQVPCLLQQLKLSLSKSKLQRHWCPKYPNSSCPTQLCLGHPITALKPVTAGTWQIPPNRIDLRRSDVAVNDVADPMIHGQMSC